MAVEPASDASAANGQGLAGMGVAPRHAAPPPRPAADSDDVAASLTPGDPSASVPELADRTSCGSGFGTLLEPVLRQTCAGRLSAVNWFRTDWQRGGALTGYAVYTDEHGAAHPSVVKLPIPPRERQFLVALQSPQTSLAHDIVPRVYAHGETLNGYDLAWVVMERLHHGPLGPPWDGREFELLVEAAGRFYAATASLPATGEPLHEDWEALLARGRQHAQNRALPHAQHWNKLLKAAGKRLGGWVELWRQRPITGWCHGDLHLGNAMTRHPAPAGPALLFDFAKVRADHWVRDAIYFEHLFWSRPQRLRGRNLARQMAQERKRHGLSAGADWARLADIYRTLLALATPALLDHDGDPAHQQACLAVVEKAVR